MSRRHEHHHVKGEVSEGLLCGDQVTVMDGIEGPAHDAKTVAPTGIFTQRGKVTSLSCHPYDRLDLSCHIIHSCP